MRARVYWPVTVAAALLVGLLAYGLTTTGTDTTLDDAMAKGERVDPPATGSLPMLGGDGAGSLADYKRQGRARQRLGLVVRALPRRAAARREGARDAGQARRDRRSASTSRRTPAPR